jgi:hypothetical protein
MNPLDAIERLITEHGSAAILSQQLAFAKDQFTVLERQVGEFQAKVAKLEAQLEIEHANHKETQQQLQRLQEEHSEEIRIHKNSGVEFRRGKRTGGEWSPFCPACHSPAASPMEDYQLRCQSKACGMILLLYPRDLQRISQEFGV